MHYLSPPRHLFSLRYAHPGTPPSLAEKPHNCSFAPRCKVAQPRCLEQLPPNVDVGPGRAARCVNAEPFIALS